MSDGPLSCGWKPFHWGQEEMPVDADTCSVLFDCKLYDTSYVASPMYELFNPSKLRTQMPYALKNPDAPVESMSKSCSPWPFGWGSTPYTMQDLAKQCAPHLPETFNSSKSYPWFGSADTQQKFSTFNQNLIQATLNIPCE